MPDSPAIVELPNGMTLLVEEMRHVQSAAFACLVPAGAIHEPAGANGTAAALCDLMTRGAGERDSRQLAGAMDALGVQRHESVGWNFLTFSGATLASNLPAVLPLLADVLRRPRLPEEQFEAVMSGIEQSLLAEQDDPQRSTLTRLRRICYDAPWNRPTDGSLEELPAVTMEGVRQHFQACCQPRGAILGVAGNVRAKEIEEVVRRHFADWTPQSEPPVTRTAVPAQVIHLPAASSQTHLALAYPAVPYGHADYYSAWGAVSILSGGSSSRLFTEVREMRGLSYSVYASLHSLLDEGRVMAYAGTAANEAQTTLDIIVTECAKLSQGVSEAELTRCKARAKSALVMQQESTASRAGAIARDWFHLRRVVSLEEVRRAVDQLTPGMICDYATRFPPREVSLVTIGEHPLTLHGLSD